ncbi:MAG: hypothetical protein P4M09_29430 [Devosia sp.]|nr:hypothetical protein [Devosia sp.]
MQLARTLLAAVVAGGLTVATPLLPIDGAALAQSSCVIWSAADEDDSTATNLTASACSSTADDSTAIGFQCPDKPQLRYYPSDDAASQLRKGTRAAVTFAVGDATVAKTMRYDDLNGVLWVTIRPKDPVMDLLRLGGPLVVSGDAVGSHTFRLLGSTAAIASVLTQCGHQPGAALKPPAANGH